MKFSVLGSGSKGNCTLVEAGSTRLLIDNGFSGKEIVSRLSTLGIAPETLTAIIVTHEHDDHIKGVGVLARRLNLPVYANEATHRVAELRVGVVPLRREFAAGEPFAINGLQVHPFSVSHDSADPVGFVVSDGTGSLGYCTDTGKITQLISHHLRQCQALVLEANHDVQMLKDGPYPLPLQQRVLSSRGHLANTDSLAFAAQLAEQRLRLVVLAHLSEINNHPDLVLREARQQLPGVKTLRVLLAGQGQVSPLLEILP
ncbi:MBL fold metallo-hydrolase [uncultured Desulfobulbus sp.]|uniref:MBL fold metallo-hydrolase n=1 Tax=uncultured Desulfobulbus sp. TaxID=239745 RepID=UPI0029C86227|nr:MBL fold metallo-hydrolase [uncultured Desulfobulbus sp.]